MIKKKKIIRIHRNPSESDRKAVSKILDNASFWEYLSEGMFGTVYYFVVKNKFKFKNITLKPGEYVLKSEKRINPYVEDLTRLSNLGLIPKIYYIDNLLMIMEYIPGKPLKSFKINRGNNEKIFNNILKLYKKWYQRKQVHGDLNFNNILVDRNLNIYFIDPIPTDYFNNDYDIQNLEKVAAKLRIQDHTKIYDLEFAND